jgi:hypothetical protein
MGLEALRMSPGFDFRGFVFRAIAQRVIDDKNNRGNGARLFTPIGEQLHQRDGIAAARDGKRRSRVRWKAKPLESEKKPRG